MKYLTLTIAVFISLNSYCQLEVKKSTVSKVLAEYKRAGQWAAELKMSIASTGDTMYAIYYYDRQYSYIKELEGFSFIGASTMREFFQLIKSLYETKKDKDIDYTLPTLSGEISIQWSRDDLLLLVKDRYGSYSTLLFTRKMLEKLNVL